MKYPDISEISLLDYYFFYNVLLYARCSLICIIIIFKRLSPYQIHFSQRTQRIPIKQTHRPKISGNSYVQRCGWIPRTGRQFPPNQRHKPNALSFMDAATEWHDGRQRLPRLNGGPPTVVYTHVHWFRHTCNRHMGTSSLLTTCANWTLICCDYMHFVLMYVHVMFNVLGVCWNFSEEIVYR